jgi:pimeloyl-ACP methyl ester carboxylesterase
MDQLELAQVDVIGMSFGARIAVELCREAPERVRSVVQLDPPLMTPREWSQYVRRHPPPPREYDDIDAAIHDTGLSPDALQEARRVMLAGLERAPGGRLRKRAHPDALVGMYRSLAEEPAGQFGAFGGRVLTLVAGAHDIHTAAGLAAREKELGMRLTLVTIEGSGHAVMWHNLAEVADHVGRFLADTAVD